MEHAELRQALGAYVLGSLDRGERRVIEQHLEDCPSCREELVSLSAVRPLLDRIDEGDLSATGADTSDVSDLARRLGVARRRERRQLWGWRLATTAALVALVVSAGMGGGGGPEGERLVLGETTTAGASIDGSVRTMDWEWGTTVSLQLTSLPRRDAYVVWVVASDGRREQAGTWGPTAAGRANVRGASGIHVEDIAAVEITDAAGNLLVTFEHLATDE